MPSISRRRSCRLLTTGLAAGALLALPTPAGAAAPDAASSAAASSSKAAASSSASAARTASSAPAVAAEGQPTVSGPVTGGTRGYPFFSFAQQPSPVDLAAAGYVEEEFFLEGTASSYAPGAAGLAANGRWSAEVDRSAPYRTRLLVIRPADRRDFNGTAFVEWNNVTASFELFPDFALGREELLRKGFAYVSVSAQYLGVNPPYGVKTFDPQRYATLEHPGDSFSYDIFTQAGRAVRGEAAGADVLGGLRARRVIADGESQSAGRMVTYINAVQPLEKAYDGFMVHSRGAQGAPLNQEHPFDRTQPVTAVPTPSLIRTDEKEPVLQFQAETDVVGFQPARQLEAARVRTWEVAGTAHVDEFWGTDTSFRIYPRDLPPTYDPTTCILPINDGPQHWVFNSAINKLDRWVRGRQAPSNGPVIQIADGVIQRDRYGLAVGGVRTPDVDAPTRVLSGTGNFGDPFCWLFGTSLPFSPGALAELYPQAGDYERRVRQSAQDARLLGFLLPVDARAIRDAAAGGPVPPTSAQPAPAPAAPTETAPAPAV